MTWQVESGSETKSFRSATLLYGESSQPADPGVEVPARAGVPAPGTGVPARLPLGDAVPLREARR